MIEENYLPAFIRKRGKVTILILPKHSVLSSKILPSGEKVLSQNLVCYKGRAIIQAFLSSLSHIWRKKKTKKMPRNLSEGHRPGTLVQ